MTEFHWYGAVKAAQDSYRDAVRRVNLAAMRPTMPPELSPNIVTIRDSHCEMHDYAVTDEPIDPARSHSA